MKKIILIPLLLVFLIGCAEEGPVKIADQSVIGEIGRDTIWSGEILVTGDLSVKEGAVLEIKPGTTVKFKHWRYGYAEPERGRIPMTVYGTLLSQGTPNMPIKFTSDAASPEHGDWSSLVIRTGGNAIINYTIFEYGWTPVGFIAPESEQLILENSILRWSTGANIFIAHGSKAVLENNRFYGAGHNNVEIEGVDTEVVLKYNTLYDASNGGMVVLDNSKATIEHNIIFGNKGITPYGIFGYGIGIAANGRAVIRNNTIRDHTGTGVMVNPYGFARIEYNNIEDNAVGVQTNQFPKEEKIIVTHNNLKNSQFNIKALAETDFIDAKQNWFNTTDRKEIALKIQDGEDGKFGKITYEPWSAEEFGSITSELKYDFEDFSGYKHQAGTSNDAFLYSFPNDETRNIVSRIFDSGFPTGVAYDGSHLWISTTDNERIYKIDKQGNILKEWQSPGPWPYGIVWGKGSLWLAGYTESKIYKLDENGNTITSFPSPVARPVGLAYDGTYLWTCSFGGEPPPNHYLYKFDTNGKLVEKVTVDREFTGLTWHEGYIWASSNYGSDKIFKIDPKSGRIVGWISSSGDRTYGLVWAEGYIWAADWTCEQWKEKKIFKLQVLEVKKPNRNI